MQLNGDSANFSAQAASAGARSVNGRDMVSHSTVGSLPPANAVSLLAQ